MRRIAILSELFNWPSTGGGTVHSAEIGRFLAQAGYEVRHIFARFNGWRVGGVDESYQVPHEALDFQARDWKPDTIVRKFREALERFEPHAVIVTDSWNFKPLFAEAAKGYATYLRLAAQECLCPLNNVRLLVGKHGQAHACPKHQFATPDACQHCVESNSRLSGWLHQQERALAGYGTPEYDAQLRSAFAEAEAVLVVNPAIAANVAPYAKAVKVIPSGFDPERFPWPFPGEGRMSGPCRLFFAGLTQEYMKGFHVLQAACRRLWSKRKDFQVIATADAPTDRPRDPFVNYIGWQSQADLPRKIRESDVLIFPTVAEEALGRTAVEAMGVGRPVIASNIGGLAYTVTEEVTGLLFEPGNGNDLAEKIERLIDSPELRKSLGRAGRKKFEREFLWNVIVDKHYKPLFGPPEVEPKKTVNPVVVTRTQDGIPNGAVPFVPRFPDPDHLQLLAEMSDCFGLTPGELERMRETYRLLHNERDYERRFGEWKTLSFEEAFLLCLQFSLTQPHVVVQIGVGDGHATHKILDLRTLLGQKFKVVCHDDRPFPETQFAAEDVESHAGTLNGRIRSDVLDRFSSGLIYLDAHEHELVHEVIEETLAHAGPWTLAIHDCGSGLCNSHMPADRSAPVSSASGVWERHILAELLGVDDPLSSRLDHFESPTHRLRIFSTRHGLALLQNQRPTACV